ncbi:CPBP family intramembrane metalloprotease [Microbacterium horticulturae]|uniref:CPBP family intramembrane metalloprotease n=1 Tax=Microbacterium horticulturae TaxID=3028316 RepID=A0ABY8BVF2_9MICO|nr:CPBP family intramembrane glutamic endopeptidase [Microbacterium sp. KACC 23027]WEG08155.1 CPBP family intramembrane metalloprotease [Microbacterium sp. KACC 23027]
MPAAPRTPRPRAALVLGIGGYLVGALALLLYAGYGNSLAHLADWQRTLADMGVLVPLVAAVVIAWATKVVIRVRPAVTFVEVIAALALGFGARAIVEVVAPTTGSLGGPFGEGPSGALIAVSLLALVVVSPVVEELFFRGLVQRGLEAALAPRGVDGAARSVTRGIHAGIAALSITVTTAAFIGLHTFTYPAGTVTVGQIVAPLAVGVVCGILTTVTGRVGGAIIAHVAFNAVGFALLLMAG